jgi:hypothetical protein
MRMSCMIPRRKHVVEAFKMTSCRGAHITSMPQVLCIIIIDRNAENDLLKEGSAPLSAEFAASPICRRA